MMRVSAGIVRYPDGRILIYRRCKGRKRAFMGVSGRQAGGGRITGRRIAPGIAGRIVAANCGCFAAVPPVSAGHRVRLSDRDGNARAGATEHEGYALVHPAEMTKYVFCPADEVVARQIAFANVRACLWDFDGTLMDTYPLLTEVFVRIAAENGVRLTAENALSLLKGTLRDACAALSALTDVSLD